MASITTIASGDAITDSRAVLNTNFSNLNTDKAETASPTLVTPVLGVATATSINKVTITQPATTATLTIVEGGSLITAGAYAITLTATGSTGVTLPTAGTLMANVVEDTTPQLGGNLDVNGNSIVSVSAGDIAITPDTTGDIILDAQKWPQADGAGGQFLQTDGAAQLSWAGVTAGTVDDLHLNMRKGSGGTITKGQPVYLSGWNASGFAEVELADANDASKMPAITIADQSITNAATVTVVVYGNMTGMVTNTFSVGDSLYIADDSTLTATRPVNAIDEVQSIGTVVRSHASLGVIQITGAGRKNDIPNKMSDAHFRVCDDADSTALIQFDASGITTATTRSYVCPDVAGTFVTTGNLTAITAVGTVSSGDVDAAVSASSVTVPGKIEVATAAETTTGTDAARAVSPDGLAGSDFGKRALEVTAFDYTADTATGDGKGYLTVPDGVGGMNLVGVHARVITAGTTSTTDIQIHNLTQTADMLSTVITIDTGETGSDTAAAPPVIDAANDDVADWDVLRIDVDAVSTTPAKGLIVTLIFQLP